MHPDRKDLLGLEPLAPEEIQEILDRARPFLPALQRPTTLPQPLRGRLAVNLFYEPSTRTRNSFELAARRLGAEVINMGAAGSSVQKGESLIDTGRTLDAMGADFIVIRHASSLAPELMARSVAAGVVNAGDGAHEHPTQALLDLLTLQEAFGSVKGLNVVIVGDILHSRVARSDLWGLTKLGARVTLVGPPTLLPAAFEALGARTAHRLDPLLPHADVLYMLRIQRERQQGGLFPSLEEYRELYALDGRRLQMLPRNARILHPGPANLGVEITEEVVGDPRALIHDQVRSGVAVRMAVLEMLAERRGVRAISA
ncbi:aspartate carbamoyltransferase [Limnochorda pilosa]|uniref:Aspartate carbamoyltransferase n=2 Tax=Limnochorda pilosa TaxID=1555112 RepID=A0A0K2SFV3_LIMPI|nr:aspartate carbamoyltransferase catalytic subunit [Limnochorda pilosa]BAS25970.1 aspartate carbamoyltransferase [Limnochorda pilosa]